MNATSATPSAVTTASRKNGSTGALQCIGRKVDRVSLCTRHCTWHIDGVGDMCPAHFDVYFAKHWRVIDVDRIHRLSDNDRDFVTRRE